jgi:hypothetical protein
MHRRPSPALVVSFLALFVALGGAGWAALRVPPNSVGTAQLQNSSVSNVKLRGNSVGPGKIMPGAVGARQVNSSQVQLRITSSCLIGAVQSFTVAGDVTCTPALPGEYGTSPSPSTLGAVPSQVAALSLSAGQVGSSYLLIGNVRAAAVAGAPASQAQSVEVHCSMSLAGSSGIAGEFDANLGGSNPTTQSGSIPLVLPVAVAGSPQSAAVTCSESASPSSPAPSVVVTPTVNAIQTAGNN